MTATGDLRDASSQPAVAVVLVNYNAWRESVECLSSLLAQDHSRFEIFLVDNDSRDGSIENIMQWCAAPRAEAHWRAHDGVAHITGQSPGPIEARVVARSQQALPAPPPGCRVTLIRSGGNLGFAAGCNVGMIAAGVENFEFFWLLNTDTVIRRDALAALLRRAQREPRIGMTGSTIRYYERPDIVQAMGGAYLEAKTVTSRHIGEGSTLQAASLDAARVEQNLYYIMGASMLVSADFVREVGLMQEDYFLYFEEIDWALRGRERFRLGYAADSHVYHKSGASSTKVMSAFVTGFYYRNRVRFVRRFFPERLAIQRRMLLIELLRHTARGRWVHARIVAGVLWRFGAIAAQVSTVTPTAAPGRSMARK